MAKPSTSQKIALKDTWVLLTGASGGIGEAIAIRLYEEGAGLLLVGRDSKKLLALRTRNHFAANRVALIQADMDNSQGREKIARACALLPTPVSILVNNAGVSDFNFFDRQPAEIISRLIHTNLLSTMLLTQLLLPMLHKNPQSLVVNIGSTFGSIGYPGYAAYCASKFGLRGFTEALRRELAHTPVRVCYVAPRATQTHINTDLVNEMNAVLGNTMDDPATVAVQVLTAIKQRKAETYIGWPEKLFVKVNQLLPKIVDSALFKQLPVIHQFAQRREPS